MGSLSGCKSEGPGTNCSWGPHILGFWTCLHELGELDNSIRAPGKLDDVDNDWGSWRQVSARGELQDGVRVPGELEGDVHMLGELEEGGTFSFLSDCFII